MTLEYAMLGFLQSTPLSGYDMKKMFDNTIRHFWSADQSQIYRTLARLTKEDFIRSEIVIQNSRPNSKVYHITEKGKEEFNRWLISSPTPIEPRISWLVQVFFAGGLPDDKIIHLLEQLALRIRSIMDKYNDLLPRENPSLYHHVPKRDLFFQELTLDYGITMNNARIRWLEKTIDSIRNKEYL